MSREIIFRGKRVDNGYWVEGFYFEATYCDGEGRSSFIKIDGSSGIKVNPDTVSQYTGLKDREGKRIFEGDVLKAESEMEDAFVVIEYSGGCFSGINLDKNHPIVETLNRNWFQWKVLGNRWDNPELLQ